jgi:hypothetical protein
MLAVAVGFPRLKDHVVEKLNHPNDLFVLLADKYKTFTVPGGMMDCDPRHFRVGCVRAGGRLPHCGDCPRLAGWLGSPPASPRRARRPARASELGGWLAVWRSVSTARSPALTRPSHPLPPARAQVWSHH